jgi:hypothetical protein
MVHAREHVGNKDVEEEKGGGCTTSRYKHGTGQIDTSEYETLAEERFSSGGPNTSGRRSRTQPLLYHLACYPRLS